MQNTASFAVRQFNQSLLSFDPQALTHKDADDIAEAFDRIQPDDFEALDTTFRLNPETFGRFLILVAMVDMFDLDRALIPFYEAKLDKAIYDRLLAWVDDSLNELDEHQEQYNHDDPHSMNVILRLEKAEAIGVEIQIEFHDQRPQIGTVLWDKLRMDSVHGQAIAFLLAAMGIPTFYEVKQVERWQPGPLFSYHPERYKQTRQYAAQMERQGQHRFAISSYEDINNIAGKIMAEANQKRLREPLRLKRPSDLIAAKSANIP